MTVSSPSERLDRKDTRPAAVEHRRSLGSARFGARRVLCAEGPFLGRSGAGAGWSWPDVVYRRGALGHGRPIPRRLTLPRRDGRRLQDYSDRWNRHESGSKAGGEGRAPRADGFSEVGPRNPVWAHQRVARRFPICGACDIAMDSSRVLVVGRLATPRRTHESSLGDERNINSGPQTLGQGQPVIRGNALRPAITPCGFGSRKCHE